MADNIRFGRPEATRQEVEAAAQAVGAEPVILDLSDRYDTEVGERGALLSAAGWPGRPEPPPERRGG